jgi:hypothetical protein
MSAQLGALLAEYERRLLALHEATRETSVLSEALFGGFDAWERLLTFKLAPRLAGDGCLIVAVAGGTNTGKSTIFNSLLARDVSPASPFGAFTRRTIVAANAKRGDQCLEAGRLLPERFVPTPWDDSDPERVSSEEVPPLTVFVARCDALPDRMAILDTPDVDSVVTSNWELAKTIREAGDVIVAVLTGQKYADKCVVDFFREAASSGRLIAPVMNLVEDTEQHREVARRQIAMFLEHIRPEDGNGSFDIGPAFILTRRSASVDGPMPPPQSIDDPALSLLTYLESIDAVELKNKILRDSLDRFTEQGADFHVKAALVHAAVQACVRRMEGLARDAARDYTPKPGREIVTVVYEFIQQHANWPDKMLGAATAQMLKIPNKLINGFRKTFFKTNKVMYSEEQFVEERKRKLTEIVHGLYGDCLAAARELRREHPETDGIIEAALASVDPSETAKAVVEETLDSATFMAQYKAYARQELETRWRERAFRWKVRLFYDLGLLGSWAGVLVLLSVKGWAPGLPLSELLASFAAPVAQHTITHAAIYLWGDKLAGLIDHWQMLQREAFERALLARLVHPALGSMLDLDAAFTEHLGRMKELNGECRECN